MNITELNDALIQTRQAIAERDRSQRELDRIDRDLEEARQSLRTLSRAFDAESEDVRRFEAFSLTGLFFMVMGKHETRLEEERREMLAAKLKYDNAKRRVDTLERDAQALRGKLSGTRSLDGQYESLLVEKERLLSQTNSEVNARLLALAERQAGAEAQLREVQEAIQAGQKAKDGLARAVEALSSAQGWGTWDLLGGGMLSSAIKHSRLDEANQAVEEAQPLLLRFERELADVGGSQGMNIEHGGLAAFADIFIDGLLVDLLVQSRIDESLEATRGMLERVQSLLTQLSHRKAAAEATVRGFEIERQGVVENS